MFADLRNKINEKENEIIAKIKINKLIIKEDFLKISENLPNKINKLLKQGKLISNDWKDEELISSINDCIQIENNIKDINKIKEKIRKINSKNITIKFCRNVDIEEIYFDILNFGDIIYKKYNCKYSFRYCPETIDQNKKDEILGNNQNIINKIGKNSWVGILSENKICKRQLNCWIIKVNSTLQNSILVGIASSDFDFNANPYYNNG